MTSIFRVDIADEFVVFRVSYTSGSDVYSLKSGRYMSNQHQVFWVIVFCCTSHIYTRAGCAHTIVLIFRHNRHMYNIYTRRSDFLLRVLLLFFVRKLSILNKFKPSRRCIVSVDVYLIWKKFQRFGHACDFELMSLYIGLEEKKQIKRINSCKRKTNVSKRLTMHGRVQGEENEDDGSNDGDIIVGRS